MKSSPSRTRSCRRPKEEVWSRADAVIDAVASRLVAEEMRAVAS
jgi:hypothetical protein